MKGAIAVLLAMLACLPAHAQDAGDDVVAKIGATEVRLSDLRRLLDAQPKEVRDPLLATPQALDRLVRTEVFRRALVAEAKARGWDKRADVAAQMERAREQALLSSYMGEIARPPADYPTEQDLTAVYNANQAEFTVPRQFRVSQIFVAVPKDAPRAEADRLKKKVDDIVARLQARDADFARFAQANSDHKPSAAQGGDLGWLGEREMIPEMKAVIPPMAKGEVAKPVKTEQGWHIVKLVDLKPQSVRPLSEVRAQLVPVLRQRRAQELERKYLDELVDRTPVAVNEIALGKLRTPAATAPTTPAPNTPQERKP
jgi:parvulin-like peptidyl-prolyl isomerase